MLSYLLENTVKINVFGGFADPAGIAEMAYCHGLAQHRRRHDVSRPER
jgi:hypothetical protein